MYITWIYSSEVQFYKDTSSLVYYNTFFNSTVMMKVILALALFLALVSSNLAEPRRKPRPTESNESESSSMEISSSSGEEDDIKTAVKALIDAEACEEVSSNNNCGDDAMGFYETFEYNGDRIIVSSGAPDHEAEHDSERPNPNTRCKYFQYLQ